MKKRTYILTAIFFLSILHSCNCDEKQSKLNTESTNAEGIVLINGEKWKVNEEMTPHISEMIKAVSNYKGTSLENYRSLGQQLQGNTTSLISSCTMDGQSHNELHKWLMPFMKNVNTLVEASDVNEAKELFKKIDVSLNNYKQYFK